jgi:hypothetical protein
LPADAIDEGMKPGRKARLSGAKPAGKSADAAVAGGLASLSDAREQRRSERRASRKAERASQKRSIST